MKSFDEQEKAYYQRLHNQCMSSSEYLNLLNEEDILIANDLIQAHFLSLPPNRRPAPELPLAYPLERQVALRIKLFSLRASARYMAELCYPAHHPFHGNQISGQDLKRWAAVKLGVIFTEEALDPRGGDFWHE